jgi:glycosyltransferase involved in cell wall biosynthesis
MGVPYVVSMHGMLDDWSMEQRAFKKKAFMNLGARKMLERAAFVHSTAQAELDQSKKWFPKGNAFVVPYIVDLEPYKNLPGPQLAREHFACMRDERVPTLLFLSRLHYKKGVEHLIRASKLLRDRGVAHNVALAGPGDEQYVQSLKKLSQDLGVSDIVSFLGMVRGDLRTSVYEAADVFVLPTSQENFGIVLLESLCCRTPVMTTKGVDIWQELQTSGAATIVENDNLPEQLASNLATMLQDRAALKAAGAKARDWGFETYAQSTLVPQFERMYSLAANSRPALATSRFAALAAR